MNAWAWLVSKSSLAIGTAYEHLISAFGGAGTVVIGGSVEGVLDSQGLSADASVSALHGEVTEAALSSDSTYNLSADSEINDTGGGLISGTITGTVCGA